MASQGERVPGVVGMDEGLLESMVQDEIPMQDIPEQDESLPQTNPEPEMGAAAAAKYDTTPLLLRQIPPLSPAKLHTIMARHEAGTPNNHRFKPRGYGT